MRTLLYLSVIILLASCGADSNNGSNADFEPFYAPAEGSLIASDSMRIIEDDLNELYYIVKLTATPTSNEGIYLLDAAFGYNYARSEVSFPRLDKKITPAIRVDDELPYSYIIGFRYEGDKTFNDYARIYALRNEQMKQEIQFRYIKSYFVDSTEKK
ncbi:MAG: hypothetical protein H6551_10530 [Chitinophagales bacterium]|nr:hypothetical protein [Chitinophagaceae bacterium]MCB9065564.1 hypothetical protein [Chitinophagales bacterium]